MRFAIGVVGDIRDTTAFVAELLAIGCIADQVFVFTKINDKYDHIKLNDSEDFNTLSLQPMVQSEDFVLLGIEEPQYYSRGIRDDRQVKCHYTACMEQLEIANVLSDVMDGFPGNACNSLLVALQLSREKKKSRQQLDAFLKAAQTSVNVIDIPAEDEQGSFHIINE